MSDHHCAPPPPSLPRTLHPCSVSASNRGKEASALSGGTNVRTKLMLPAPKDTSFSVSGHPKNTKRASPPKRFVEPGGDQPAGRDAATQGRVYSLLRRATSAVAQQPKVAGFLQNVYVVASALLPRIMKRDAQLHARRGDSSEAVELADDSRHDVKR